MRYVIAFLLCVGGPVLGQPYGGTAFVAPNILTDKDPTAFTALRYRQTLDVRHYDSRANGYVPARYFRFVAQFSDGQRIEMDMNGAFGSKERAEKVALFYANAFGRIPQILREDVRTIIIHEDGDEWYALPGEITIHFGSYVRDVREGVIEESMIHEGVHASLDRPYDRAAGWRAAQAADGAFISDYGRDNPRTEDLAETFTLFYGMMMHPERITARMQDTIKRTIPNRMAYLQLTFPREDLALVRARP